MEHLEGQTLAQRLEKGALPLDQALQIAIEIADALDKAHRQGLVHRDLEPGNIMLTKGGAKLLDFGLAKPTGPGSVGSLSAMPTQSAGLTAEGSILGTIQYMAPEQLEGAEVDARTDLFAFGTSVYELVTGARDNRPVTGTNLRRDGANPRCGCDCGRGGVPENGHSVNCGPRNISYPLELEFENEELRQRWIASPASAVST